MHIQIIVSRKDITGRIKLSRMNTSRGRNEQHSAKLKQFDRVAFKESGGLLFDKLFDYNRSLKDSIKNVLIMNNGKSKQKQTAYLLNQIKDKLSDSQKDSFIDTAKIMMKNTDFSLNNCLKNLIL